MVRCQDCEHLRTGYHPEFLCRDFICRPPGKERFDPIYGMIPQTFNARLKNDDGKCDMFKPKIKNSDKESWWLRILGKIVSMGLPSQKDT
jgi:hypothetical protein